MTYTYKCDHCQKTYEVQQRISEEPLRECKTEGCEHTPKRIITNGNFILNGGGWYKDGY